MYPDARIRTRRDGSIDTAHYIALSHKARSRQAHRLARHGARRLGRVAAAGTLLLLALALFPAAF